MKTYITINKTATMANSKKEAAKKLGVTVNNIHISAVHIDYLKNYKVV
ncbi:hypothetical protein HZP39_04335 [Elizabethkingia anophelis]|nr:hypothetical protein [Elizabethkingia anophelis]MCT4239453.1 hypothetical protein [Elizabethkingia anophelis]MCT4281976.1 hypothetical protein [Elizabethkingia anophelis]MCT4292561.1 hypothetical protein [Elizabethkingia anophelis]